MSSQAAPARAKISGVLQLLMLLLAGGAFFGLCMRWFAAASVFADLGTSFVLIQFQLAALACVVLLCLRAWKGAAFAAISVVGAGSLLAPYTSILGAPVKGAENGHPLRAMLLNVWTPNEDTDAVVTLIRQVNPDFFVAQEIDARWTKALQGLADTYPHHIADPRGDNFGIGLWSKHPLLAPEIRELGNSSVPAILCTLDVAGRKIRLLNLHTLPPLMRDYAMVRNEQLKEAASLLKSWGSPSLLVGDLNITVWSPHYQPLAEAGMRNAREGQGIYATWPVGVGPSWVPIDHVLVSSGIAVADFQPGPRVGSDHLPVWADLLIP